MSATAVMKIAIVSDSIMPSLIQISRVDAPSIAGRDRPARVARDPPDRAARPPRSMATPSIDDASRCAVTPSSPIADHSARYDGYSGG